LIELGNGKVSISVDENGELYKGSRFCRQGMAVSFRRDGIELLGKEGGLPGFEGLGLCNEFGLSDPIGYDDEGSDVFLKIGVGWLKKTKEPYREVHQYEIASLADARVEKGKGFAAFLFDSGTANGYGVKLRRAFELLEDGLRVEHFLENTGEKAINTSEYCHNFMRVNGFPVDSLYRLETGHSLIDNEVEALLAGGSPMYYSAFSLAERSLPEGFSGWKLSHGKTPLAFEERCDFQVSRFAVWGTREVASAECFRLIGLSPGESASWARTYLAR
jgi:hypothetical protein